LAPDIRHYPFDAWEDQIIIDTQREIGNRWAVIAQKIPKRSPSSIKNRWYSGLKHCHGQGDLDNSFRASQGGILQRGDDDNGVHGADL
jgi:hypothetical protein